MSHLCPCVPAQSFYTDFDLAVLHPKLPAHRLNNVSILPTHLFNGTLRGYRGLCMVLWKNLTQLILDLQCYMANGQLDTPKLTLLVDY